MMEALGVGIVSGLVVTLIVVVFRGLWIAVIQPWYEERIYRDAKIEGQWKSTYANSDDEELIELKRKGHRVSGVITVTQGTDHGKAYNLDGTFKNLILTASYSAMSQSSLDRGSYTLMLIHNGQKFKGHCAYYCDEENQILSEECEWEREDA
jgi:hypothetical protein